MLGKELSQPYCGGRKRTQMVWQQLNRNYCSQPKVSLPLAATRILGGCKSLDIFSVYVRDQNYTSEVLKL